jgi:signal transduction histidine kinase
VKKLLGFFAAAALAVWVLAHSGALSSLFSANYVPHRYCYLAQPGLVWTNVAMDSLIAASYGLIFGCLFWIAGRLRSIRGLRSYLWIFLSFGIFIAACGATHLMEVVTIWYPVYPLSAAVKVLCAAASVPTAILFAKAAPALEANMRRFLDMLSTTQQEKDQALRALIATEKLAVAGRISASISHEIKNPLDTVGNLLYLVAQDQRIPADLLDSLNTARSELNRANGIARNTLSLYRESSAPLPLSLSDLVRSVLELQTPDLIQRNIVLEQRLRTPAPLKASSGELRQIVINLIQNAAVAIGTGGRILVRVQPRHLLAQKTPLRFISASRQGQSGYSITVADTGPGVDPENRSQLFTLFFTTKGDQGTGLGLWLVRSMVEKQGGRIRFRSRTAAECGRTGTIFNVWLPMEPAPIAASAGAHVFAPVEEDKVVAKRA